MSWARDAPVSPRRSQIAFIAASKTSCKFVRVPSALAGRRCEGGVASRQLDLRGLVRRIAVVGTIGELEALDERLVRLLQARLAVPLQPVGHRHDKVVRLEDIVWVPPERGIHRQFAL